MVTKTVAARGNPSVRVQRVLARFELGCPALRDLQVSVEVLGRDPVLVLLPAGPRKRGRIDMVVTAKGRLRTCSYPAALNGAQRAAIADLAWALYETLGGKATVPAEAAAAKTPKAN